MSNNQITIIISIWINVNTSFYSYYTYRISVVSFTNVIRVNQGQKEIAVFLTIPTPIYMKVVICVIAINNKSMTLARDVLTSKANGATTGKLIINNLYKLAQRVFP